MKAIPGYSFYTINEEGRVYSILKKRYLRGLCNRGYMMYFMKNDNGLSSWQYSHRIMCTLHHPNPDNKPWVNHKDGNKGNNRADNLEWSTISENIRHAWAMGLSKPCTKKKRTKEQIAYDMEQKAKKKAENIDWSKYSFSKRNAEELKNLKFGKEKSI